MQRAVVAPVVVHGDVLKLFPDDDLTVDTEIVTDADLADAASLAAAAELSRGTLLPDSLYDDWTTEPRSRLHLRQLDVLRAAGRWQRALELDPTDEMSHVGVMKRAFDRGDRDAVIRQFAELEAVLAEHLGVLPARAAVALRDQAAQSRPDVEALPGTAIRTFVMTDLVGSTPSVYEFTTGGALVLNY